MGVELVQIGAQIRKFVIFSTRACYRSVLRHPFIVGMVLLLIFLYRSFPFVFSLLVSASPVIVSTAVLLGTLLSFGHPNIPEIEKEETSAHEISALKTGVMRYTIVVERDGSSGSERFTEGITEVIENSIKEKSSVVNNSCEVDKHDSWVDSAHLTDEQSLIEDAKKEPGDRGFEQGTDLNEDKICGEEVLENHYSAIRQSEDEKSEMENDKLPDGAIDSRTYQLHSTQGSPWKHVEEDDEDDDDVASDLGSDLSESSSPDASMADIMPLLDELHPLLDEEVTQPVHMSHDGSDAASEHSLESSDSSNESDGDITNQEGFEAEEEEERHAEKEDETKSAITWTEDDQKNLMNLGTSELERNQRLENLIARRRARKNMRMMAERNLIDLEADLPFNVAHIQTARHNPFDFPFDSNDNVPGSAPSVLLPRSNPFDLPYDSSEEKPDLVGDTFRQDFGAFQQKESFFRRHESFNVGPSFFGASRHERQETKLRPYFVPERIAAEGSSYPSFQRQLSEVSDSKASSVPETESMGSAGDLENGKHIEDEFSQEADLISTGHASEHVSHGSSVPDTKSMGSGGHLENEKHIEDDFSQEAELISITGHAYEHVDHGSSVPDTESMGSENGKHIEDDLSQEAELMSITGYTSEHVAHGSLSSEDVETIELGQIQEGDDRLYEVKTNFGDMEDLQEVESIFGGTGSPATPVEANLNEIHLNPGVEQEQNCRSSLSSVSEVNEEIFNEKEGEGLSTSVPRSDYSFMDPSHSMQTLIEKSDNITSLVVEDSHQKEPVYDSSPRSLNKNLSSSSISTDLQAEIFPMVQSPVKRSISFAERDSEASAQSVEEDTPGKDVELVDSSERDAVDNMGLGSRSFTEVSEPDVERFGFLKLDENSGGANDLAMPDLVVEHNPTDSQPHSGPSVQEDLLHQDEISQHTLDQLQSSSFNADLSVVVDEGIGKEDFTDSSSKTNCAEDQDLAVPDKEESPLVVEQILTILPDTSLPETDSMEEHLVDKEAEDKVSPGHQIVHEEKITSRPEKELQLSDESMDGSSMGNPEEIWVQLNEEMSISNNLDISKTKELDNKVSPNIYSAFPPEPSDTEHEGIETKAPATVGHLSDDYNFPAQSIDSDIDVPKDCENVDEINEIEESILVELDTVGDFSIKDLGSNLNEIEKQQVSVEDSILSHRELETNSFGAEDCDTSEVRETKFIVDADSLMTSRIEVEISHGGGEGASEVQISRTSSTENANEVISPENVESTVNETGAHRATTGVVASVEHEVGTSSEGPSLSISDVKGKNENSHKSSSSSSSSSSSDSSDSDKE